MTRSQNYLRAVRLAEQANHYTYGDGADPVTGAALAAEAQVYAMLELADATRAAAAGGPRTVYRASRNSIAVGLYEDEADARTHCQELLSDEHAASMSLVFDWLGDEEGDDPQAPRELVVQIGGGDEQPTGYVVTPLTVDSAYDAGADS